MQFRIATIENCLAKGITSILLCNMIEKLCSRQRCSYNWMFKLLLFLISRVLVEACRGSSSRGYSGGPRPGRGRGKYVLYSPLQSFSIQ